MMPQSAQSRCGTDRSFFLFRAKRAEQQKTHGQIQMIPIQPGAQRQKLAGRAARHPDASVWVAYEAFGTTILCVETGRARLSQ